MSALKRRESFGGVEDDFNAFCDKLEEGTPVTLHDWLNDGQNEWPDGADGFRLGKRGKVVWTNAFYSEAVSGNWVQVARNVSGEGFARVSAYDRDTIIRFVYKACARCEGDERPVSVAEGAPYSGRLVCTACARQLADQHVPPEVQS